MPIARGAHGRSPGKSMALAGRAICRLTHWNDECLSATKASENFCCYLLLFAAALFLSCSANALERRVFPALRNPQLGPQKTLAAKSGIFGKIRHIISHQRYAFTDSLSERDRGDRFRRTASVAWIASRTLGVVVAEPCVRLASSRPRSRSRPTRVSPGKPTRFPGREKPSQFRPVSEACRGLRTEFRPFSRGPRLNSPASLSPQNSVSRTTSLNWRDGSSSGSSVENAHPCTGWGALRGGTPICLSCGNSAATGGWR